MAEYMEFLRVSPGSTLLTVTFDNGASVAIHRSGEVEFRGDYQPEAHVREFWTKLGEAVQPILPSAADAQKLARLEAHLHSYEGHPDYEYRTTDGPRKSWWDSEVPPEGEGWARNVHMGREGRGGWERFEYHEESYWMRERPEEKGE